MSKRSPKKRRRTLPALGLASVSLSMASGACAVIGEANASTPPQQTHEIFLAEEEISDVSLATFYVFNKERPSPLQLARGGCGGGGGGCGHGGGCHGGGGGCGCHAGCAGCASWLRWRLPRRLRWWLRAHGRMRSYGRMSHGRVPRLWRLPWTPLLLRRMRRLRWRLRRMWRWLRRRHLLDMDAVWLDLQLLV